MVAGDVYTECPSTNTSWNPTVQLITAFINNPVKVAVAVLLLVLFGVIALFQIPVELTPHVEQQWLSVSTTWPGAGPQEIEREIVYEQEKQLKSIPGMNFLESSSSNSRGRVSMGFDIDTDMNEALVKVNSALQQISSYPETALEPKLSSGTDDSPEIAMFNIVPRPPDDDELAAFAEQHPELADDIERIRSLNPPTVQLEELRNLATRSPSASALLPDDYNVDRMTRFVEDHIAAAIGRVPGVARTWLWGDKQEEMRVIVDPAKLAVLNLTLTDIRNTLRERNHDAPAGQLNEGKRRFDVRVMGRYTSPDQILAEVVTVIDGTTVTIGDLAEVRLMYRSERDSAATHFATRSLRMGVIKEPGANLLEVMAGIHAVRDRLNNGVLRRQGLLLFQSYDDTEYVSAATLSVRLNMLAGAVLTTIVLLLFLRSARSTLIVGLAIPVSIIGTLLCLRMFGRTLNVISMAGMSFAIGMLVDNAVVVLENIYRHYQTGEKPFEAARRGTVEVWGATLASTLTTLAVFVPVLFVQEESGQLFRDIAIAISCGVGLSLLVSVVVIPTAAARVLRSDPAAQPARHRRSLLQIVLIPLDAVAHFVARTIIRINRRIQRSMALQLLSVGVFVVGAIGLAVQLMPPVEYLPEGNRNSVRARLVPPPGYNVEQIQGIGDRFYERVRPYLRRHISDESNVDSVSSEIPAISDYTFGVYSGRGYISTKAVEPNRAHELVDFLKSNTEALPGVETYVSQTGLFEDGWGSSSRVVEVHVIGPELERLVELGKVVRERIYETLPGATAYPKPTLEMSKPEMRVIPDKLRAAEAGLTTDDIGFTVDAFIDSAYADKYILDGDEIDLSLGLRKDSLQPDRLEETPIATADGSILPLSAIADIQLASGLDSIRHINRERSITLFVTPPEDVALADAIASIETDIVAALEESGDLDGLYRIALSGTADKLRSTWSALRMNLLIAVLITYLLMAALFESWSYPLVIMVTLPLAAVGGIAGLRIVGLFTVQHLDIITMLGFVILVGTVVNNAILIVHQALNNMREDGQDADAAVVSSVATRIRPIFMTTITTTFGLLPMVVTNSAGSELYRGLGSVVLGGLVLSTLFTLFLVPSLFSLMHAVTSWWSRPSAIAATEPSFRDLDFLDTPDESSVETAGVIKNDVEVPI